MHALLHGEDIVSAKHARSSIGHQHVLTPKDRTKQKSAPVMRQLLARAAQRLREEGFFCRRLTVEVKWLGRDRELWTSKRSFSETQDTGVLLRALEEIWHEVPDQTPLRVGVVLSGLAPEQAHQPDLFDKPNDARLVTAIDQVNAKFGKGAITYGAAGADQTSKIAFQRVPKVNEF
jgi:DNA polymerase IV